MTTVSSAERNKQICDYYQAGNKVIACAKRFQLGRMRILQILKAADVYVPYEKGERTKFLGVTVKEETKNGLTKMAEEEGVSVSQLTSDALDALVEDSSHEGPK